MGMFTLTADGSSTAFTAHPGEVVLQAAGTFGSGTLTVEKQLSDDSTWQAFEDGAFTSGPISQIITLAPGQPIRVTLAGATSPSITGEILSVTGSSGF